VVLLSFAHDDVSALHFVKGKGVVVALSLSLFVLAGFAFLTSFPV
jgi:hypothetical protein